MAFVDPNNTSEAASNSENESSHEGYTDPESDSDNNYKIYDTHPALRNARNLALMAEEKLIIEMLKSIKQQRNALKVEALYYQGLKANLYAKHAMEFGESSMGHLLSRPLHNTEEDFIPDPMFPDQSPGIDECFEPKGPLSSKYKNALMKMKQMDDKKAENPSNLEDFTMLEGQCNSLELQNLTVDHEKRPETWDVGDPEYESEEEDWNQVNLDMSMLVGGSDQEDDD